MSGFRKTKIDEFAKENKLKASELYKYLSKANFNVSSTASWMTKEMAEYVSKNYPGMKGKKAKKSEPAVKKSAKKNVKAEPVKPKAAGKKTKSEDAKAKKTKPSKETAKKAVAPDIYQIMMELNLLKSEVEKISSQLNTLTGAMRLENTEKAEQKSTDQPKNTSINESENTYW